MSTFFITAVAVMKNEGTVHRLPLYFSLASVPFCKMNSAACSTLNYAFNFSLNRITVIKHSTGVNIFNMPNVA